MNFRSESFIMGMGIPPLGRRGITVLTLLLIIIAVIVAAIFLIRYLRHPV
jgi:hypothetical protein